MVLGIFRICKVFTVWAEILQVMETPVKVNDIPVSVTEPLRQSL